MVRSFFLKIWEKSNRLYYEFYDNKCLHLVNMAAEGVPLLMRIVSASVSVSHRAAKIARDILTKGDLGIIEKVKLLSF